MNNLERAAEVIDRWTKDGSELNSAVGSPHRIATLLADAGLLMPDLPEPVKNYDKVFVVASPLLDCRSVQAIGDQVAIHGYKSRHASSGEARRFAYALLAAADHAEQEHADV